MKKRRGSLARGILLVSGIALVYGINQTMYRPLVAPYAVSLGAGPLVASTAVAASSIAGVFMAVPAGLASQRFREGWLLLFGGLVMSAAGLLAATAQSQLGLLLAMTLAGVATVGIALSVHGLSTAPVRDGHVDTRRVAAFGIFVMLGQMVGPIVGGVLTDLWGYSAAFWVVAGLGVAMGGVGFSVRHMDRGPTSDTVSDGARPEMGSTWQQTRRVTATPGVAVVLLLSSTGTLLLGLRNSLLPLYLDQIGWTASEIGLLLSGSAAAALVVRVLFPAAERRMRPSTMFAVALLVSATGLAGAVATTSPPFIMAGTLAAAALLGAINPASLTLLSRLVVDSQRRLTLGVRITARNTTQLLGPMAFGAIAAVSTVRAAFFCLAFVAATLGGAGANKLRHALHR